MDPAPHPSFLFSMAGEECLTNFNVHKKIFFVVVFFINSPNRDLTQIFLKFQ
jgi:hypothetical protein